MLFIGRFFTFNLPLCEILKLDSGIAFWLTILIGDKSFESEIVYLTPIKANLL